MSVPYVWNFEKLTPRLAEDIDAAMVGVTSQGKITIHMANGKPVKLEINSNQKIDSNPALLLGPT